MLSMLASHNSVSVYCKLPTDTKTISYETFQKLTAKPKKSWKMAINNIHTRGCVHICSHCSDNKTNKLIFDNKTNKLIFNGFYCRTIHSYAGCYRFTAETDDTHYTAINHINSTVFVKKLKFSKKSSIENTNKEVWDADQWEMPGVPLVTRCHHLPRETFRYLLLTSTSNKLTPVQSRMIACSSLITVRKANCGSRRPQPMTDVTRP